VIESCAPVVTIASDTAIRHKMASKINYRGMLTGFVPRVESWTCHRSPILETASCI